jgi:YVTN family beta-propeller protein
LGRPFISESRNIVWLRSAVLAALVGMAACSSGTGPSAAGVASIQVTPDAYLLTGSQTLQLVAVARDSLGNAMPSAPITFLSRDPTIVTVSNSGLVTRVGVGTAYVAVASGVARDSAEVTALVARVMTGGTPFAAATYSTSSAYVTLESVGAAAQMAFASPASTGQVNVGSLPTSIAVNQAGTRAYVGNQGDGSVSVINTATNAVVATIAIGGSVLGVLLTPGDSLLLVGTDLSKVYVVRTSSSAVIDSIPAPIVNGMAMRGDTTVFASGPFAGVVAELNLRTRQRVRTLPVGGVPQGLLVSPSGTQLYLANEVGQFQVWDLASASLVGYVDLPGGGGYGLTRHPSSGLVYVSTSYIGARVHVINPATRQIVRVIHTGGTPRRIAFAPDGSVGIVANEGGWVDYIK